MFGLERPHEAIADPNHRLDVAGIEHVVTEFPPQTGDVTRQHVAAANISAQRIRKVAMSDDGAGPPGQLVQESVLRWRQLDLPTCLKHNRSERVDRQIGDAQGGNAAPRLHQDAIIFGPSIDRGMTQSS